ncbi:MAG: hypothetical protein A2X12_06925 [Bacteroidetes bacterium GWE2_29_8]|nr:MAG: hypothetical protein A2X12_06925 [Bacteroidetes bacterium GWE2_29_8]
MQNINSITELSNAIKLLEIEQLNKKLLLKDQLRNVHESLRPINIIKSTINDITTSPYLLDNILATGIGLVTGYFSNKIFVGSSGNLQKKLLGSILQFGVTNVIAQNPDAIKSLSRIIFHMIFKKRNND